MDGDTSSLLTEILVSLGILAGFVIVGKGLIILIDKVIRQFTQKTETVLDDLILAAVEKPAYYLIILWGAYIAFHRLKLELKQGIFDLADSVVFVIAIAFVVKLVYDVINALLEWYGITSAEKGRDEIGKTVIPLVKKLVKIFTILSGIIVVLDHFHYSISSLVAALGVSSLAVGLAAKDTLTNMISGFIIMADRPFRLGDRIETDGKSGDVVEIGIRSTKVRTLENNILIIPNTKLVDNVVLNQAYPEYSQTHFFKVGVEYGSDVEKVKKALLDAAHEVTDILDDPAPQVYFTEHGESALIFQMMYRVPQYVLRWSVQDKVNTAANRRFTEEGINLAYPTRTVYVRQERAAG